MVKKEVWQKKFDALKLAISWAYKSSKFLAVAIILVSIFGGLLTIIEPYVFKLLIDFLVGNEIPKGLGIGLGIAFILIVYGTARILQNLFWDVSNLIKKAHTLRIERYAVHSLMKNISSLDLAYFEDPEYYNTLTRANESLWRVMEVFWQFTFLVSELVSVIVIIGALIVFDWRLVALVIFGAIPSIVLALRWADVLWSAFIESSPIFRHAHYYRSLLTEQPQAVKEIRSFGLKEHFLSKFRNLFNSFLKRQDKAVLTQFRWYIVIGLVEGSLSVIAAWLVVSTFLQNKITIGDLTFLWAILFQFAGHTRWVVRMIGDMNTHTTFITSIIEVLNLKPRIIEAAKPIRFPAKIKKGIEFKNVTFYYPKSKKPALENINLFIRPGDNIALVGENGSGKTTLIKLMCRLYDVTEGEILIDGINIKEYSLESLYDNLGVIFQDFMKYEALIEENIGFGRLREKNKEMIHTAALKSGAWEFIKTLERKYKTQLGKKIKEEGIELSIGQWQKIALSRAFFRDSQILILDEPTSAVDAKAEYELFQKFRQLTKNKTTFLISHRFSTVRMANKIIVIENGRLIESGSHKELLDKKGAYAKLFNLQAKGYK